MNVAHETPRLKRWETMNPLKQHEPAPCCRVELNRNSFAAPRSYLMRAGPGIILLMALPVFAQQTPPALTAGTKLRVLFNSEVGTGTSRVGDGVEVRLLKPAEADGREVLPLGTVLSGRVLAVRKGDKHRKAYPMIGLAFSRVTLPDGRTLPVQASLADLGTEEYVDSEGAASTRPPTKGEDIGVPVATGAAGAGVGAIAGGGKGAAIGAGAGAAVGALSDLAEHVGQWQDFALKKGRKAWLRLDADLVASGPPSKEVPLPQTESPGAAPTPSLPLNTAPTAPARKGTVYVEPVQEGRFHRVNEPALRRDLGKAGMVVVEEQSEAGLLLRVWQDSHGFHADATDRKGTLLWAGSAATQGGLVRGLTRYMSSHGLVD